MAKEKKDVAVATEVQSTSAENIREQLDNASMGRVELAKAALEKISKDRDERTQQEMMVRFQKAQYRIDQGYLNLRRERDIAKITQAELAHTDRLARYLMGFEVTEEKIKHIVKTPDVIFEKETVDEKNKTVTVVLTDGEKKTFKVGEQVPPVIDYVDYDSLYTKIRDYTRKESDRIEKEHSNYTKKLQAKYGEYWNHSWYY